MGDRFPNYRKVTVNDKPDCVRNNLMVILNKRSEEWGMSAKEEAVCVYTYIYVSIPILKKN